MAVADSTENPSTRRAISIATPLQTFLSESPRSGPLLDAETIVRELITRAGLLSDVAPSGDRFVLVALPPRLLEALAAHLPPAPQPMPLLEWRA